MQAVHLIITPDKDGPRHCSRIRYFRVRSKGHRHHRLLLVHTWTRTPLWRREKKVFNVNSNPKINHVFQQAGCRRLSKTWYVWLHMSQTRCKTQHLVFTFLQSKWTNFQICFRPKFRNKYALVGPTIRGQQLSCSPLVYGNSGGKTN